MTGLDDTVPLDRLDPPVVFLQHGGFTGDGEWSGACRLGATGVTNTGAGGGTAVTGRSGGEAMGERAAATALAGGDGASVPTDEVAALDDPQAARTSKSGTSRFMDV